MFWCISFHLGAFVTISLLPETWCKTRQTGAINVKVSATKSCHNFSQRALTILTIGPSTNVLVHFFPFGCIWDRFAIARKRAKLVQLIQKFVPRCLVRIFHKERSLSMPLYTILMFWCVSFHLGHWGLLRYCTKLSAKCAKLVQLMKKFV